MLKRKLLKRIMPFLLSLAMAFQAVPMTALAVEDPQAAVLTEETDMTVEPEAGTTEDSSEDVSDESRTPDEGAPVDTGEKFSESTENSEEQTGANIETGAGENTETTAGGDASEPGEAAAEPQVAVNSTEIFVYYDALDTLSGFTQEAGADSLTYTTPYSETDRFGDVMAAVKSNAVIKVNGVDQSGLKEDYLFLEWREAGKTEAMTGTPQNVGSYVLHLETRAQEGVCAKVEKDVYFNITPRELKVYVADTDKRAKAGSKVADYKETVTKAVVLKDGSYDFTALAYTAAVEVYELKDGAGEVTADTVFNKNKDYRVKVEVTFADAEAAKNYEVTNREFPVTFGDLLETKVEIRTPDKEMVETYEKDKTYTASAMAEKYGVTAEVRVKDADEPLEGAAAAAKWYTKEINQSGINGFPTAVDGITQFLEGGALYTLVTEEKEDEEAVIGDVGDYYLVFVYEGVDGQYEKSHSNPLKVTIDPIEVILKPTAAAELNPAMTDADINSVLAQVESKLYMPDAADPALAGAAESDAPAAKDKDFYGVSYDNADVTQYYSPEFVLVYRSREKLKEPPAGAAGDDLWTKWTDLTAASAADIKKNTDEKEYKYFVRFTGRKVVYNADGGKTSGRPISEATDAANRNYKVKTDADTLNNEKNMLEVTLGETKETAIDVTEIIKEFNKEGGRGKDTHEKIGLTADDPAWTVYDPDLALFEDRASYKKAVVREKDTENALNPEIKDTHKDLTYTWQISSDLNAYYEITRMEKNEGEKDEDFAERKKDAVEALENTFSGSSTVIPQDAGLYRLHIAYKDTSLVPKNAPAVGYAYFLIKKQELVFAADLQYANYDDSVWNFEKKNSYRAYALPDNDEEKIDWEKPLGWYTASATWQAMNLKKNADGSNGTEWEKSTGKFVKNDTNPYVYKAAVWLYDSASGQIKDTDNNVVRNQAGTALNWRNYTTRNMAAWDADNGEYKQRYKVGDGYGDIKFDAAEIKIVVDRSKLFDDKIYDAKPIAERLPEGFVKLTDADGVEITDLRVNGEPTEGISVVNVAWKWNKRSTTVPTEKAIFGGDYTLAAWFEGNDTYAPYDYEELKDKDGGFTFTINPLKVEITPILKEEATAGDKLSEMLEDGQIDVKAVGAETIPEEDAWLFVKGSGRRRSALNDSESAYSGYPILTSGTFVREYYENNVLKNANERIRYDRDYVVKFADSALYAQYAASYDLIYKPAVLAKINRGDADVEGTDFFKENSKKIGVSVYRTDKSETGYQIVPREGIPFVYADGINYTYALINHGGDVVTADILTGEKIPLDKNYIAVNVVSPREFACELAGGDAFAKNNFVYGNSIKAAGGYVIDNYLANDDESVRRYYITALFPVELDESGKIKEIPAFNVTWETDYTDTFKFDLINAKLEANLKRAVAPKSLAFNGVQSKMAIGEEQQLDVKMTKAQLSDVVRINYRLAGGATSNEYASINPETGLITALATNNKKPMAVNVEAYPVRLAEDGKTFEEITGKGVKIAKTKVTITEVTAPVIKKVLPKDTSAEIQFTKVDDGYRGEIYVVKLENKKDANKWKPANFEDAIKEIKNGQWKGTFAIEPKYLTGTRGYNETLKLCRQWIYPPEKGAYAVYVRNVSAVRTLADGSKVTESAAGTVKVFETTKSLVRELMPYFEVTDEKGKNNPVRYTNENQIYIADKSSRGYTVELADKSAQLLVDGKFLEKSANAAADSGDPVWYQLSLKVAEKALGIKLTDIYQDPKLTYFVTDNVNPTFDEKGKITNPSKYVTISNSGKLTFKGVDKNGDLTVRIYVADSSTLYRNYSANTNAYGYSLANYCTLTITARPDTLTTKKVKTMKVGDAIRLKDYLEYKSGKTKVPNFWSTDIEITNRSEVEDAGFEIYQAQSNGETHPSIDGTLRAGEYIIIAKKAGAKCDLKLKDRLWKTAGSDEKTQTDEVKISLSTTKIDPVKGLKAVYTDDKAITVNFAHAGHPEAFDIEVKDARGSVVYKRLAYRDDLAVFSDKYYSKEWYGPAWIKNALTNLQRANLAKINYVYAPDGTYNLSKNFAYFAKTKTYAYTISTEKLMRLSSYTISVTPVYGGETAAKAATTKAKTTNIPASYEDGDIVNPDSNFYGISLYFNSLNGSQKAYLTSGNTYTVTTGYINNLVKDRGTDTLTWKSSNPKVASIKANQGSFSATLKALSQGKTTITVTSKVTKKTIARYHIAVKAVGKADHYGGDYETGGNGFYDDFIKTVDPYYEGRVEVLTVSNSVTVDSEDYLNSSPSNDRTWVKFTAPSYGEYVFSCTKTCYVYYDNRSEELGGSNGNRTFRLEEGQSIYFKAADSFTLRVESYTDFTRLTTAFTKEKPLTVNKAVWVSFTATEDNYYTFNSTGTLQFEQNGSTISLSSGYNEDGWYAYEKGMKAGETIFIKVSYGSLYVTRREFTKTLAAGAKATLSFNKDNQADAQYVKFTAGPAGEYSFTYKPSDKVDAAFLAVDGNTQYYDGGAVLAKSGASIYAEGEAETAEASETVKLFMDAGETVVIKVTVKAGQGITEDAAKIDVEISAAAVDVKPLAAEQTVTKNTTQIFGYTILNDTTAAKYTLTATEGAVVEWYNDRWSRIYFTDNSFTVADGKVTENSLKAGDKIYIKVTAAADKDSKVTLTSVTDSNTFDTAKPAAAELSKAGDAKWYTFAVKKAGYYEFTKNVTVEPAGSAAQTADVKLVQKAFSESNAYVNGSTINLTNSEKSNVMKLSVGDYVFMIKATSDAVEGVKTNVTLSVKEIVPTAIAGTTAVELAKGETKYYTFKRATDAEYTIKWTKDAASTGDANVTYTNGDLAAGSYYGLDDLTIRNSGTYTIKVEQIGENAVKGALEITAAETNFLTSGKAEPLNFAKNGSKVYKFTLPEDSALGYMVIVENTSVVPEGQTSPTIRVTGDVAVNALSAKGKEIKEMTGWTAKFTTKTITITAAGVTEAAEGISAIKATGTITIKPITANPFNASVGNVKKGDEPKWYTYTVPADGRYELDYAVGENQIKNSVRVGWYKKNSNGSQGSGVSTGSYLTKDQDLYIKVEANDTIAEAGVDVTLKPALLKTTALTIADGKAEADVKAEDVANGAVYYTLKAPAYATYTVMLGESAVTGMKYYRPDENGSERFWYSGNTLEKDDEILITVNAAGKLTVTQKAITELTLGKASEEITVKAGESADFVFHVFEDGYYDFTVDSSVTDLTFSRSGKYRSEKYMMDSMSKGVRYRFAITNNGGAEAKIKVTAQKVTPVALTLGENSVPVAKDRAAVVEFTAPEDCWYTVSRSDGSSLIGMSGMSSMSTGEAFYSKTDKHSALLTCPGAEAAATPKITIAKVAPEPAGGEEITVSLAAGESKWYAYTAAAAGSYTFTSASYVNIYCYKGLDQQYPVSYYGEARLAAGETLYIRVMSNSKIEDAKITVEFDSSAERVETLRVGTNSFSSKVNETIKMTFTAGTDAIYTFSTDADTDSGYIYYYGTTEWDEDSLQKGGNSYSAYIEAGTEVYLKVQTYSTALWLTVTKKDLAALHVGENDLNNEAYEETYMTFTPQEDGVYIFKSAYGDISYYGGSAYDEDEESYESEYTISAGRKVYLKVYSYSADDVITVINRTQLTTELLGNVSVESGYQWITFTAPRNGDYIFYSTDRDGDPKAWFFDDMSVVDSDADSDTMNTESQSSGYGYDDDGSDGLNFSKLLTLSAGDTVYIAVGYYHLGSPLSCKVYVSY